MSKVRLAVLICFALLACVPAFAVDGQILINQATVTAAGGFPYKITQPGSYKLSGNLSVSGSTDGILICATDVTLDLNGFVINGNGSQGFGISNDSTMGCGAALNVTVKNGVVRGFYDGVILGGSGLISDLQSSNNSRFGIWAAGGVSAGFVVTRCVALSNTSAGIKADYAVVNNSISNSNSIGFDVTYATAIGNLAVSNGTGMAPDHSVIGSNTLEDNSLDLRPVGPSSRYVSQGNNICGAGAC